MKTKGLHSIKKLMFLGVISTGLVLTSCSSTQQYVDTDGVYNSERQLPQQTHFNKDYYSKYFEEKNIDAEHFTNIDDYSSYQGGAAPWGEDVSQTVILNHAPFYNHMAFFPHWHYNWGWHNSFWSWNYGWGSWHYPYLGYNYGWTGWYYPTYGYYHNNNVSYATTRRLATTRTITPANRSTISRNSHRTISNSTLANTRNISTARMTTRVSDYSTSRQSTRSNDNVRRTNDSRNYNTTRTSTNSGSRISSRSSTSSRSFGGSMGGGRSMGSSGRR